MTSLLYTHSAWPARRSKRTTRGTSGFVVPTHLYYAIRMMDSVVATVNLHNELSISKFNIKYVRKKPFFIKHWQFCINFNFSCNKNVVANFIEDKVTNNSSHFSLYWFTNYFISEDTEDLLYLIWFVVLLFVSITFNKHYSTRRKKKGDLFYPYYCDFSSSNLGLIDFTRPCIYSPRLTKGEIICKKAVLGFLKNIYFQFLYKM